MNKSSNVLVFGALVLAIASTNIGYGICLLVNHIGSGAPFLGIGGALLGISGALFARTNLKKV